MQCTTNTGVGMRCDIKLQIITSNICTMMTYLEGKEGEGKLQIILSKKNLYNSGRGERRGGGIIGVAIFPLCFC